MSAAQLRLLPGDPEPEPVTYWGWRCRKGQTALDCLVGAKRHRRLAYGDEVLAITVCSSFAAQLPPDTAVPVITNESIPAGSLYCTVGQPALEGGSRR